MRVVKLFGSVNSLTSKFRSDSEKLKDVANIIKTKRIIRVAGVEYTYIIGDRYAQLNSMLIDKVWLDETTVVPKAAIELAAERLTITAARK